MPNLEWLQKMVSGSIRQEPHISVTPHVSSRLIVGVVGILRLGKFRSNW